MGVVNRFFVEKLGGTEPSEFIGNSGEVFYDPESGGFKKSDGSTPGGTVIGGGPAATGFITMNGASSTWTGTANYTVSFSQDGTDNLYDLTFPIPYASTNNYIVQATWDGLNYISGYAIDLGVNRYTTYVRFTPRDSDGNGISLGDIMVTIHNL